MHMCERMCLIFKIYVLIFFSFTFYFLSFFKYQMYIPNHVQEGSVHKCFTSIYTIFQSSCEIMLTVTFTTYLIYC